MVVTVGQETNNTNAIYNENALINQINGDNDEQFGSTRSEDKAVKNINLINKV